MPGRQAAFELGQRAPGQSRKDDDYKFVLAEIDYLKPYFDASRRTGTTWERCSPGPGGERRRAITTSRAPT